GDSQVAELLQSVEARDDLVARLDTEFDHELLQEALLRARLGVEPHTFEAFGLTAVDGRCGPDAARQLCLPCATVFVCQGQGSDRSGGTLAVSVAPGDGRGKRGSSALG